MKYGLIGEKLGHSFSKEIHEELASYTYELLPMDKEALRIFMDKKSFNAINVTIPYKQTVLSYLDEIDSRAKKIGAVNTIVNNNGVLCGYNTDYSGFAYMLEKNKIDPKGKKVLILGKGGASKACIAVLEDLYAKEILSVYYAPYEKTITYEMCYTDHRDADIIINTTPVGMYPNSNTCPINLSLFTNLEAVVDVIYNPLQTKLLVDAMTRGIKAVGGLEMLVAQAKFGVEIFTKTTLDNTRIHEVTVKIRQKQSNIVLIGMSGCGKTFLGKEVARSMGREFIDTDDEVVNQIGMSIAEFFECHGEFAFREIEKNIICRLAQRNSLVISTGGGIVKDEENIALLKENGVIIWLTRDTELLEVGKSRPLASTTTDAIKLYQERLPLYKNAAQTTVANNQSITLSASKIQDAFNDFLK